VASIKHDYKWTYLNNGTLVFAYQKIDKVSYSIVYWNTKTNEKIIKQAKRLLRILSCD
jgi:WD repeat-containing protein 35